jgi:hypothetical protein
MKVFCLFNPYLFKSAFDGYIDFRDVWRHYIAGIHHRYQFENCSSSSGSGKFIIADEDDYSDMPDQQGFRRRRKGGKWTKTLPYTIVGNGFVGSGSQITHDGL